MRRGGGHQTCGRSTHIEESFASGRVVHDRRTIKLFDSWEGGAVMKHERSPILFFVIIALLGMLAIGGGPVVFMVLVMASPLIAIMIFGASLLPRHGRHDHTEYQRR